MNLKGQCPCGAVNFAVEGDPVLQCYCHCRSCQLAHAAPLAAVALFPAEAVSVNGQTNRISVTGRPHAAQRISCARCGCRVLNIPAGEKGDALRAIFPVLCDPGDWFTPSMHIYWAEHSVKIDDELPKYLDIPAEYGGTGRTA